MLASAVTGLCCALLSGLIYSSTMSHHELGQPVTSSCFIKEIRSSMSELGQLGLIQTRKHDTFSSIF